VFNQYFYCVQFIFTATEDAERNADSYKRIKLIGIQGMQLKGDHFTDLLLTEVIIYFKGIK